ncbi:MAG: type IV toxin-antitoxin system AbiEi family antitoxin [Bacteroidota bacterium]
MNTQKPSKINQLLFSQPSGVVLVSSWLTRQGYSLDLQKSYRKSGWLESMGNGAMIRRNDIVEYEGAIYALQKQLGLHIHIGGKTALSLLGKAHYINLSPRGVTLFGGANEKLPTWFKRYDWGVSIDYHSSSFLKPDLGLVNMEFRTFSIKISGAARSLMECLYLAPKKQPLLECYQIMESLNNLRPDKTQQLLENCSSVKVKRLFLYMAEKANHEWFQHLSLEKIYLGSGKRSFINKGVYVRKYKITVPRALEYYD